MSASTYKIEVFVFIVAVMRPKIAHLENIMAEAAEDRAPGNITGLFPVFR